MQPEKAPMMCSKTMTWKVAVAIFLCAAEGGVVAQQNIEREVAQILEGTIYVVPHRESADGVLKACGLEFAALTADFSTRGGAHVRLVGSFYLRSVGDGILYMLKMSIVSGEACAEEMKQVSIRSSIIPQRVATKELSALRKKLFKSTPQGTVGSSPTLSAKSSDVSS